MKRLMQAIDDLADALVGLKLPWWVWPTFLVLLAVASAGASLFFRPMGDEWVAWPGGSQLGDTCAMILITGQPCPQCGMTRSWVHGIRGDLLSAFWYSPSGLALLGWILVGGLIGLVRLLKRDPDALSLPPEWLFRWAVFWLAGLYALGYALRLIGINALP